MRTYRIIGRDFNTTLELLPEMTKAAKGKNIQVSPYDDALIVKLGLWIKGDDKDLQELIEKMREKYRYKFVAIPVVGKW